MGATSRGAWVGGPGQSRQRRATQRSTSVEVNSVVSIRKLALEMTMIVTSGWNAWKSLEMSQESSPRSPDWQRPLEPRDCQDQKCSSTNSKRANPFLRWRVLPGGQSPTFKESQLHYQSDENVCGSSKCYHVTKKAKASDGKGCPPVFLPEGSLLMPTGSSCGIRSYPWWRRVSQTIQLS